MVSKRLFSIVIFLLFSIILVVIFNAEVFKNSNNKTLRVWSLRKPYSLDPLEYDALAHHICFRSVFSPLVTDYRLGKVQGIVAEKWTTSTDGRIWNFYIRGGMFFTDGDPITPESVAFSLNRIAIKMLRSKSHSGLFEYLDTGEDDFSYTKLLRGISFDSEKVTLVFIRSIPDLLSKISFGIYSIVNFKNFDQVTGNPLENNKLAQSGPYRVIEWSQKRLVLVLRDDFPREILLKNPIHRAEINFINPPDGDEDIIIDFDDSNKINASYAFYGPVRSAIRYIECVGYQDKNSICYKKSSRALLKKVFYLELEKYNLNVIKSFFPLAINGVKTATSFESTDVDIDQDKQIKIASLRTFLPGAIEKEKLSWEEAFELSMRDLAKKLKLNFKMVNPEMKSETLDFKLKMTAILVDSPRHDIRFMFLSQHGIKLPDVNGNIHKVIENDNFDIQQVNEEIWNQNVVWPIGHMSLGIWSRNHTLNLSQYNFILPPLDLQWLSWE